MLAKRIIPCLDVKDGQTVKGINFLELRYAGNPVELAKKYSDEGADELVFLDISATHEKRPTRYAWVEQVGRAISIPFTVGGGITCVDDVGAILACGADKVALNSAALNSPELITEIAARYGRQCVVVAIDAAYEEGTWRVYKSGGRVATSRELFEWAAECEARGAGELLFTTMSGDGTQAGFAYEAVDQLARQRTIPVIASGGAGSAAHFVTLFSTTAADAALAASIFHYGTTSIAEVKETLKNNNIPTNTSKL
ncbi:MAG: imidazole glycerol phosphate synthase subunit HisF [Marinifilaceae bacterium]